MKSFSSRLLYCLLLCLTSLVALPQQKDTLVVSGKLLPLKSDSIYIKEGTLHISGKNVYLVKNDSVYLFNKNKEFLQLDSLQQANDSLYRKQNKSFQKNAAYYAAKDSLFRKTNKFYLKQDSLSRKKDSLFRKSKIFKSRSDSLFRVKNNLFIKQQHLRLDSLKSLNWRKDSFRIRGHLERLKSDLQRIKIDSARQNLNLEKKVISFETKCDMDALVTIKDMGRKLVVKTWDQPKIKIETVIFTEAAFDPKDIDWKRDMNIGVDQQKEGITISKLNTGYTTVSDEPTVNARGSDKAVATAGDAAVKYTNATIVNRGEVRDARMFKVNGKSELVIYVPFNARLNVVSRYNELSINNNMVSVELDLMNTDLKMLDADKATIKSRYGSVKTGNIKDAAINLVNCKFTSGDLDKLVIDSRYSTIVFKYAAEVNIKSFSDKYNILRAGYVTATKSFGDLNISLLENSIKLTGSSADLNIKLIDSAVKTIQVDNKYANMKLPVEQLLNYSLQFGGNYSNVFTGIEKLKTNSGDSTKKADHVFSKIAGNAAGAGKGFIVNCSSCSVDFR